MPRSLRRLVLTAGVAGGLAVWRNRMLAANARTSRQSAQPTDK